MIVVPVEEVPKVSKNNNVQEHIDDTDNYAAKILYRMNR